MKKQLDIKKETWNQEFSSGRWDCLDENPTERARHAIIGMYYQKYFPDGKILDVGCGEGTLTDFLNNNQKQKYLGIDISEEAIKIAKKKRLGIDFQCIAAESFEAEQKFDIIVFNEVLYYTDDSKILEKYSKFLKDKGIIILSLYRIESKKHKIISRLRHQEVNSLKISKNSQQYFVSQDSIEVSGRIDNQKIVWKVEVMKKRDS